MRIVIIGEFSSFAKNLSDGFRALGHECFVFSWGDWFKKIEQDKEHSYTINAHFNGGSILRHLQFVFFSTIESLKLKRKVYSIARKGKFDVVLIINSSFIKEKWKFWQAAFTKKMIYQLASSRENIFLSACGGDVPYYDYWKDKGWKNKTMIHYFQKYSSRKHIRHHLYVMSFANKIIPVMYGYAEAWRKSKYSSNCLVLQTIPLPVNCSNYTPHNEIDGKIVIFHGITRPEVKGTKYIVDAMDRLQEQYPDKVECRAEGGMPLKDYLQLMERTNILIDQSCCEYVGMNGLYGMAMGKVLLGGNETESQKEYNDYKCPILNIEPDAQKIFSVLERLVLNNELIENISMESRKYVERVHDSKVIADKYIKLFSDICDFN